MYLLTSNVLVRPDIRVVTHAPDLVKRGDN
jgi:hypothetical protein